MNSDHLPIHIEIEVKNFKSNNDRSRITTTKVDWTNFKNDLIGITYNNPVSKTNYLEEYDKFIKQIHDTLIEMEQKK